MQKMLVALVLVAACSGGSGEKIVDPGASYPCTFVSAASSFTVNKGTSVTVNYSSNCQSVRAEAAAAGFPMNLPASGSFSFTATQNMTVILTGVAPGKPSVSAAVTVNVIVPPPPILKISAPAEAYLNQTISVAVQKTNTQSCTPVLTWKKSNKEPSNTIVPAWDGSTFSPGSTMPVGNRVATLVLTCVGLDGSQISDSATVQLRVPKLEIDSISPSVLPKDKFTNVYFYSSKRTIVSGNGEDFNGTLAVVLLESSPPPTPNLYPYNASSFGGVTVYGIGVGVVGSMDSKAYIFNSERPEQPLVYNLPTK